MSIEALNTQLIVQKSLLLKPERDKGQGKEGNGFKQWGHCRAVYISLKSFYLFALQPAISQGQANQAGEPGLPFPSDPEMGSPGKGLPACRASYSSPMTIISCIKINISRAVLSNTVAKYSVLNQSKLNIMKIQFLSHTSHLYLVWLDISENTI